ncbi:MAG: YdeI/OmpD-associated family protein [Bacteroidetes bacterium]|nr:YdeI/OmpD-associated family protein [Bacteroidota bacterium]
MIQFNTTIQKFGTLGEKTGWTYILIPEALALELKPGNKQSFRVKGKLDQWAFKQLALIPMGDGDFILALNAEIRKQIKKNKGATISVQMAIDKSEIELSTDLMLCLEDDPAAKAYFNKIPGSHQKYYSRWIDSAKTDETKAKRIALALKALARQMDYGSMIREDKDEREKFK